MFLFEATEFEGEIVSSEEGEVAWYPRDAVPGLPSVKDLEDLLQVMESDDMTEFIYRPDGDGWKMLLR